MHFARISLAVAAAVACGATAHAAGFTLSAAPKIAFLYFADKGDGGWTQAFDEAKPKMEAAVGMKIPYVENVPEVAGKITPAAESFINRGYNVIIGTAFGYSDTFKSLSEKYPKVAFLNASGTTNGPNLESFYGRTYESQYLCGMVAGAMSKSGKLGFVAAHPIGPVNWTINAYELGAQKMNPNATVTVIFTGSWNDPVKERSAAQALADQGIDVIGQHVDTPTPQIVAQERGLYGTGHHRDLREFAPKATLCSLGLDLGQVPRAGIEENHCRELAAEPLRRFPGHQGWRHRYRLLQQRRAQRRRRQGHGRAQGHHRGEADLHGTDQRHDRQGAACGRKGDRRRRAVEDGLVRTGRDRAEMTASVLRSCRLLSSSRESASPSTVW